MANMGETRVRKLAAAVHFFFREVYQHRGLPGSLAALSRRAFGSLLPDETARRLTRKNIPETNSLDEILTAAYNFKGWGPYWYITPIQTRSELYTLAEIISKDDPKVVLEIGSMHGGTFFLWCQYFDSDLYISVNLPHRIYPIYDKKSRIFGQFTDSDVVTVSSDSHEQETKEHVSDILDSNEIDFLFVDGDHSYHGVKKDFQMYGDLVRDDGIIVFDDIHRDGCGVKEFWEEISENYQTKEISGGGTGFGILYK